MRTAYGMKRMPSYSADAEDWIWHTLLPLFSYGAILGGAITLSAFSAQALFAIGGAAVLMIFIGIHNAWDIVTFIAIDGPEQSANPSENKESQ